MREALHRGAAEGGVVAAAGGRGERGRGGALDREVRGEEVRLEVAVVDRGVRAQAVVADPEVRVGRLGGEVQRRQEELRGEHLRERVHDARDEEDCAEREGTAWVSAAP